MNQFNLEDVWVVAELMQANQLTAIEEEAVKQRCAADANYAFELQEQLQFLGTVANYGKSQNFRAQLKDVAQQNHTKVETRIVELPKWWKTAAIAAGVAVLSSMFTVTLLRQQRKNTNQYQTLKREIQQVRDSQNQIIKNINDKNAPTQASSYSGTGFAITNNGYVASNYHVIEGADSIYIQTGKGFYHKAYVVATDAKNDIALLKVYDDKFKFSEKELPYTLKDLKSPLGAKVFTLGYPQDEIVYNEGYISSVNGFRGDSNQYRLVLPAGPGQSGAPILDAKGNLVGMVTARNDESGTEATYAVKGDAISDLIVQSPKKDSIKLTKNNRMQGLSREQQLANLQQYTCMIRVYK